VLDLKTPAIAIAAAATMALAIVLAPQDAGSQSPPTDGNGYSAYLPNQLGLPTDSALTIAALDVPQAGNYIVDVKLEALNASALEGRAIARCFTHARVEPGETPPIVEGDMATIDLERDRRGMLVLQFAYSSDTPETVVLRCLDAGTGSVLGSRIRITATQVSSLTNTRILP
jgi:hypothetical protein